MAAITTTTSREKLALVEGGFANLRHDKLFLAILLLGILLRVVFVLVGAKAYYGVALMFTNGDSDSYMLSFRNLVEHGTYTFNFAEPDAAFGRLPGYPFFYGIHYYLFGIQHAILATACTQALLDCVSIGLVFLIVQRLAPNNYLAPYVAAALYAAYPFIIVWTTIIGTELLATFLTLLWLYTLLGAGQRWMSYVLLGIELALVFYVREFMGILLPITCLYLLVSRRVSWPVSVRHCVLVCLGFGALYIWWPTRNYVSQHRVMLVKPERAGFSNYKPDMVSFLDWVHGWSNESSYWLQQVLNNPHPAFPANIFASPQEQAQAQALVQQANECGSSFFVYRNGAPPPTYKQAGKYYLSTGNCNEQLSQGFEQLRQSFKQRHPIVYYTRVPLADLRKIFFKSGTQSSDGATRKQLLLSIVFGYRTLLLVLGVLGLLVYRKNLGMRPILMFWSFIVVFMCWYFRQLEMRYLLQADVLLLVPASLLLSQWLSRFISARSLGISAE